MRVSRFDRYYWKHLLGYELDENSDVVRVRGALIYKNIFNMLKDILPPEIFSELTKMRDSALDA